MCWRNFKWLHMDIHPLNLRKFIDMSIDIPVLTNAVKVFERSSPVLYGPLIAQSCNRLHQFLSSCVVVI